MSEEKRTPLSIYLTPRAAMILRQYNMGSGYGSKSRTVEEIILAFDSINVTRTNIAATYETLSTDLKTDSRAVLLILTTLLQSIDNSLSRLNKASK